MGGKQSLLLPSMPILFPRNKSHLRCLRLLNMQYRDNPALDNPWHWQILLHLARSSDNVQITLLSSGCSKHLHSLSRWYHCQLGTMVPRAVTGGVRCLLPDNFDVGLLGSPKLLEFYCNGILWKGCHKKFIHSNSYLTYMMSTVIKTVGYQSIDH